MRCRRLTRCETCGLSENLCICSTLPLLTPQLRVVILAHRRELAKPTNTGKICARMLGSRAELLRSDAPAPHDWSVDAGGDTWVLFPSEDALPLEHLKGRVGRLIIPDGTWAQARRIARRHPGCRNLAKVRLANPPPSGYRLRRNQEDTGLCTLEAVAHALGVLEGPSDQHSMLACFGAWVELALRVRAGAHMTRSTLAPQALEGSPHWTAVP